MSNYPYRECICGKQIHVGGVYLCEDCQRKEDEGEDTISDSIFDKLEPDIEKGLGEEYTLLSIAISLKRIADSLETIPNAIQLSIQEAIWNATRK